MPGTLVDGIYQYAGDDAAAPSHTLWNKLGDSVRTRIAALVTTLTGIGDDVADLRTAWTPITPVVTWTNATNFPPLAYRLVEDGTVMEIRSARLGHAGLAVLAGTDYNLAVGLPVAPLGGERRTAVATVYYTTAPSVPQYARLAVEPTGNLVIRPATAGTINVVDIPWARLNLAAS